VSRAPPAPAGEHIPFLTMIEDADIVARLLQGRAANRLEARSVTGACYTLVEEAGREGSGERVHRHYRTAYAGLPVVANDDGSFTIVDTDTRLVRVDSRRAR
jgi:hypothetical protein